MFVKVSGTRFVNLANMTDAQIFDQTGEKGGRRVWIYWNIVTPGTEDEGPCQASDVFFGADAEVIIDALDAAADAERRKAL